MYKIGQVINGWEIIDIDYKVNDFTVRKNNEIKIVLTSFF
jgi:hypothetical protein